MRNVNVQTKEEVERLKNKVGFLEAEIIAIRRLLGTEAEEKDPQAWQKLKVVGKRVSKDWKNKKPSWRIISEARR